MTTRSVDNYQNIENYNDVVDVLVQENAVNNVPNGNVFGEIAVWNGSTWALEGSNSVSIGQNAGLTFQSQQTIALGLNSGRHNQNSGAISIGFQAGRTHQSTHSIAIGLIAGSSTQGLESIAIGMNAAQLNQGDRAVSIGSISGLNEQKLQAISIGYQAGGFQQGTNSIAIGAQAGFTSQGQNSVAIGFQAGMTAQPSNSIVLNASNTPISGITQNSCYINPIRNVVTGGISSNYLLYDSTNRELVQATNLNFVNPVSFSSGSNTLPSIIFSEINTGIFRSGLNQVAITTNGTTRLNVGTGVISCALGLALPTVGGTATNLDYYEETSHSTTFTYGNKISVSVSILIRRIGRIVSIFIPYIDHQTNTNGLNVGSFSNTALLSRFRPQSNAIFSINVQNNAVYNQKICLIRTDGVIEILDVNQGGYSNNTRLESYASYFTYFL